MAGANQDPFALFDFVGMFGNAPRTPEAAPHAVRPPPLAPRRPPYAGGGPAAAVAVAALPVEFEEDMPVPVLHRRQLIVEALENDEEDDMDQDDMGQDDMDVDV